VLFCLKKEGIFVGIGGEMIYEDWFCKEESNYVFPENKLNALFLVFIFHKSVSDLYILRIGLPFLLQPDRQTDRGNR
jgi:hypothetical protein